MVRGRCQEVKKDAADRPAVIEKEDIEAGQGRLVGGDPGHQCVHDLLSIADTGLEAIQEKADEEKEVEVPQETLTL